MLSSSRRKPTMRLLAEAVAERSGRRPDDPAVRAAAGPELAGQLQAGAAGITCAKLGEAEVMADAGLDDLLIAYPLVGEHKLRRLRALGVRLVLDDFDGDDDLDLVADDDVGGCLDLPDQVVRHGLRQRRPADQDLLDAHRLLLAFFRELGFPLAFLLSVVHQGRGGPRRDRGRVVRHLPSFATSAPRAQ